MNAQLASDIRRPIPSAAAPRSSLRRRLAITFAVLLLLGPVVAVVGAVAWESGHVAPTSTQPPERIWGGHGRRPGEFERPRAMTIDPQGLLYIVDKSARIQVFDQDGQFLRGWQTPQFKNGKPTGLSFNRAGELMVADTHYFRILFYRPDGTLLEDRTMGGVLGHEPGTFGLVTDAVEDSHGNLYVSEYGEYDRIQKFAPDGRFLFEWGGHGSELGQFARPQSMALDEHDHLWVADACNDRIQVFDATGTSAQLIAHWGTSGSELGELRYPYDLLLAPDNVVYICEFGNHRIQKFTREGKSLGSWGRHGRRSGELYNPWAIVRDDQGRLHVLDTYNHRVQRVRF